MRYSLCCRSTAESYFSRRIASPGYVLACKNGGVDCEPDATVPAASSLTYCSRSDWVVRDVLASIPWQAKLEWFWQSEYVSLKVL